MTTPDVVFVLAWLSGALAGFLAALTWTRVARGRAHRRLDRFFRGAGGSCCKKSARGRPYGCVHDAAIFRPVDPDRRLGIEEMPGPEREVLTEAALDLEDRMEEEDGKKWSNDGGF